MPDFNQPSGSTPIDPDEMEGLKLRHITTRQELDRFEQDNIADALRWLERRRKSDILTETFVRQLHRKMFGRVWKWAGTFRRSGKNIGVDWTRIPAEVHTLLADVRYWIEHETYGEDEIALRLHHRLVLIHPFANGNGRLARLLADILLDDIFEAQPFSWDIPGGAGEEVRKAYLAALRRADHNDYAGLLEFAVRGRTGKRKGEGT